MVKRCLQIGVLASLLLAGCVQPTPTPTATPTAASGGNGYPGPGIPTATPLPPNYPGPGASPTAAAMLDQELMASADWRRV